MNEDPCDGIDATWVPPTKNQVWCPVHCEPMESCACKRDWSPGVTVVALLVIAVLGSVSLAVAALLGL